MFQPGFTVNIFPTECLLKNDIRRENVIFYPPLLSDEVFINNILWELSCIF